MSILDIIFVAFKILGNILFSSDSSSSSVEMDMFLTWFSIFIWIFLFKMMMKMILGPDNNDDE